jgi:hypothetical protein
MRALSGAVPRAFRDHRTHDGRAYRAYCRGVTARLGELPPDALPTLREAGRCAVELERLGFDLEAARARRRPPGRRDASRIRRQLVTLRTQLVTLERRLEEHAQARPVPFAVAARRAAGGGQ